MKDIVSIIIPIYNAEKYIVQCLESVVNQTYKELQIIVVNDGSKDNSLSILESYANKYSNILLLKKENGGVSSARNLGLNYASGKYITFIDADDFLEKNHIENLVNNINSGEFDLSICLSKWAKRENQTIKQKRNKVIKTFDSEEAIKHVILGQMFPGGYLWNKLFKREKIGNLRFNESIFYGEDLLFTYYYLKNSKGAIFENIITYHYVKTPNSLVRSKFNEKKLTIFDTMHIIIDDLATYNPSLIEYAKGLYCLLNFEIWFYLLRDKVNNKKLKIQIKSQIKNSIKSISKSKLFKQN